MNEFERQFCQSLSRLGLKYEDYTASGNHPDVKILRKGTNSLWAELKEKRSRINLHKWPTVKIPEHRLLIVDELTCRKLFFYGPDAVLVVWDRVVNCFYFTDALDLWVMPRVRANRPIETPRGGIVYKGKWLLDLKNFNFYPTLPDLITGLDNVSGDLLSKVHQNECLAHFEDDPVLFGGEVRTEKFRRMDRS